MAGNIEGLIDEVLEDCITTTVVPGKHSNTDSRGEPHLYHVHFVQYVRMVKFEIQNHLLNNIFAN